MSNYKIKSKAFSDMEIIFDYIAKDNKKAARKLIKNFYDIFEKISSFPEVGKVRKDFTYKDVRFFTFKKHYLIIYNIEDNIVCIQRVLTAYQDICALL